MGQDNLIWLTREAHDRLEDELENLKGPARAEISQRIAYAREQGDLRENGGYHAAREEQSKAEARIVQLEDMLSRAKVVEQPAQCDGTVAAGMEVTVRFSGGDTETFLLGTRELLDLEDTIELSVYSPQSPLGSAIVGKKKGGAASYTAPNGNEIKLEVIDVARHHSKSPTWQPERAILSAHRELVRLGSRGPLPAGRVATGPGILYVVHRDQQCIDIVLADNLRDAVDHLESTNDTGEMRRTAAYWAPGSRATLREESPALTRISSAARRSAPYKVSTPGDWKRVPPGAGVYRIYLYDESGSRIDRVYVGRASNFQDRPRRHPQIPRNADGSQRWGGPNGVAKIALIYAKGEAIPGVWTSVDLDDLEARHILRMQSRHVADPTQPRVINITAGRNGPPSRSTAPHWFRWFPEA